MFNLLFDLYKSHDKHNKNKSCLELTNIISSLIDIPNKNIKLGRKTIDTSSYFFPKKYYTNCSELHNKISLINGKHKSRIITINHDYVKYIHFYFINECLNRDDDDYYLFINFE